MTKRSWNISFFIISNYRMKMSNAFSDIVHSFISMSKEKNDLIYSCEEYDISMIIVNIISKIYNNRTKIYYCAWTVYFIWVVLYAFLFSLRNLIYENDNMVEERSINHLFIPVIRLQKEFG